MEILESILVIQTAFLGDAVLTLPMIQKLKEQFPVSNIYVLCIPSTEELFSKSAQVKAAIVFDKNGRQKSILKLFSLIKSLRGLKLTRVYSPHRSFRSTLIAYLCGANYKTGFEAGACSLLYSTQIKYCSNIHEVARNLKLIGIDTQKENWKILPQLKISQNDESKVETLLNEINLKKIAAVAPGSVWRTKKYPEEYFVQLIHSLLNDNYFVFLIGGMEDKILCENILANFSQNVRSFAGNFSVTESVAFLKHCNILISNDSAPTHLGMIANIPTLTIYCSTVPHFGFYPYNEKSDFISFDDLKCKPCGIHGLKACPIKTFDCGFKLLPELVIKKIREIASE